MADTDVQSETIEIPTEYLEMDPLKLANDEEGIKAVINYLRGTRENIREAEKAGKRITSKSAVTKAPKQFKDDPLNVLLKEV